MKTKTKQLTGRALDFAVAKAEGHLYWIPEYTTGPEGDVIIDREMIATEPRFLSAGYDHPEGEWQWRACLIGFRNLDGYEEQLGPTRRIAAMRAWVVHKLGEYVEVPDELVAP